MSIIHMNRIESALKKLFIEKIDMSDYKNKKDQEKEQAFLSRAVAAYALVIKADIDFSQAAESVTDGYNDNGIDALYFDKINNILYVVQSKWINDGNGCVTQSECKKLIDGFYDLVNLKIERFNFHIQKRKADLESICHNSNVTFVVMLAHTGTQPESQHVTRDVDEFLKEMNNPDEVLSTEFFNQSRFYKAISSHSERTNIKLEIIMHEWGCMKEPYRAFYGQVDVRSIAEWWKQHGRNLFVKNLRYFKGNTDVNQSIAETLHDNPEHFWYFNNGITILCTKISKKPIGATSRETGIFDCEGVNIVNGAQTVGMIGSAEGLERAPDGTRVLVRIISLESCPDGFDKQVTRGTNTQNRIDKRDFAALDPNQQRLANDLLLDGKRYSYKSGDQTVSGEDGCDIVEATIALACANEDVSLAITAKREIGNLWNDINQPPYTKIFNESTTATELWKAVRIMRKVTMKLAELGKVNLPRADMVTIYGDRLILHRVFNDSDIKGFRNDGFNFEQLLDEKVPRVTEKVFHALVEDLEHNYSRAYLATLFKNMRKCVEINKRLSGFLTSIKITPETENAVKKDQLDLWN